MTARLASAKPALADPISKSNDGKSAQVSSRLEKSSQVKRAIQKNSCTKTGGNSTSSDPLQYFNSLPLAWQRATLQKCGGTGDEPIDMLRRALEPKPIASEAMRIADSIQTNRSWKGHCSAGQEAIIAQAADDFLEFWNRNDAWLACRSHANVAQSVADRTKNLSHVSEVGLRLLTADDSELLTEAKKKVEVSRNRLSVHPRDRDAGSVRRRLRRAIDRAAIYSAALLGLIGGPKRLGCPDYADDWTVRRFQDQRAANKAFLKDHVAVPVGGGQPISMAVVAMGAAASRRAMWYSFIMGMREIAKRDKLVPVFVTLTLPAEWHLNPQSGKPGDPSHSPSDGAREIGRRWHNAICLFRDRGGRAMGIRVAEPDADATVHLHSVLWLPSAQVPLLAASLGRHFPASTANEHSAREKGIYADGPALVLKTWEERKDGDPRGNADAASYALSYILDVLGDDASAGTAGTPIDRTSQEQRSDMDEARPAAWARHVRLRRLSLVGLEQGVIGRWTEFYRSMKSSERSGVAIDSPFARSVAHAMKRGQWGTVLRHLGALRPAGKPVLRTLRTKKLNRWGESVSVNVGYFKALTGEVVLEISTGNWRIEKAEPANSLSVATLSIIESYPRDGPAARPPPAWSG